MTQITKTSMFSGRANTRDINITPEQYVAYMRGTLGYVQTAFPHLSADDREFLITGCTPEEWDALFNEGEAA